MKALGRWVAGLCVAAGVLTACANEPEPAKAAKSEAGVPPHEPEAADTKVSNAETPEPEQSSADGTAKPEPPPRDTADLQDPAGPDPDVIAEPEPPPRDTAEPQDPEGPDPDVITALGDTTDLQINLQVIEGERSRDSHQTTVRCTVDDTNITYYGPHGTCERGRCPHKEVTFELSTADRDTLAARLKELGLLESFSETSRTDSTGSYVSAKLHTRLDGGSGTIAVAGMLSPHGATTGLSEQASTWRSKIRSLRTHLTKLARAQLPDAH